MTDLKHELESLKIDRSRSGGGARRWPLLLFVPAVLGLLLLYGMRARQALFAQPVETIRPTLTSAAQAPAGTPLLTASGYVVARRKAVVSAKIQGRLSELRVEEGSRVRKGEVLARLESLDYEASLQRAQAAVQRAEADLAENQRQLRLATELVKGNVLAEDQRQATESRVRIADAMLSQARADAAFSQAQLQNTVIRAPFSGVVVKKMAEVGESVAPIPPGVNLSTSSGAVVALADLDTLEVEADVAEANVSKLGDQQPAEVTVEALPDRKFRAVLRQVIPTADRTKATVQVKVTILEKDKDLKPEMSAKVTFLERAAPASAQAEPGTAVIMVPKAAVVTRDGRMVVFEVVGGKARVRGIAAGAERQGQVVVKEGLSGGETLVSQPPAELKDGDAVRIKG